MLSKGRPQAALRCVRCYGFFCKSRCVFRRANTIAEFWWYRKCIAPAIFRYLVRCVVVRAEPSRKLTWAARVGVCTRAHARTRANIMCIATYTHSNARVHTPMQIRTLLYSMHLDISSLRTCAWTQVHIHTQARGYVRTNERTHACTHALMHAHTHLRKQAPMRARTYSSTHARQLARTHARTHTHTHARMHARTHARAQTQTQTHTHALCVREGRGRKRKTSHKLRFYTRCPWTLYWSNWHVSLGV